MTTAYDYFWYDELNERAQRQVVSNRERLARALGIEPQEQKKPIAEGDELRAVIEADILLMEHHSERHGCGCLRHRAWRV